MLVNELKSALLKLMRHRLFTFVNLVGLAVCFACVLLLGQYLRHELSYDEFHSASDRLYRAWIHEDHGEGKTFTDISTPIILAPTLRQNFPEIERAVRVTRVTLPVRAGEEAFEESVHLADADFLSTFSFEWLAGDPGTAFSDINTIVLTPALAEKYFGSAPPLGRSLELRTGDGFESFRVVGLIAPPPQASTLQFQAIIPFSEHYYGNRATSWFSISVESYLLLEEGVDAGDLEERINGLMRRVLGPAYPAGHYLVHLQPMTSIHLDTSIPAGMEPLGDPVALYLVASGVVLLLVIGGVNYVAITLGGIARRTREVGLRRTLGARVGGILKQFCVEAAVVCLLGLLLGLALAELYLPVFNELAATSLALDLDTRLLGLLLVIFVPFVLLAGGFPVLMLLRFKPSRLLSDRLSFDSDKSPLMRGLIVFQFALAIMMLVSSVAVALQMRYIDGKDLGFDAQNLLVVPLPGSVEEGRQLAERFIGESAGVPFIEGISYISAPPGEGRTQWGYTDDAGVFRQFDVYAVGPGFLPLMGMELVEGRSFRDDSPIDALRALIVNEAFLREYGWEEGVGRHLPGRDFPEHDIVGVVRDANFHPLTDEVRPTVFARSLASLSQGINDAVAYSSPTPELLIRLGAPGAATLPALEEVWERIQAGVVFEAYWLEEALARQYRQQANFRDIVQSATLIAVFVAAIGLFALAVLMTQRRRREIGIRKVMGGGIWRIVVLLTNDFSKMVLLANVIAWPVAYFAMERWLSSFAYRIDLTPLIFIGSGLIALSIAWVTVGGTAAKAASAKPVLALRYE